VVDAIVPSVRRASRQHIDDIDRIVEIHIQGTVDQLLSYPEALAEAVAAGRCAVVGMSYQLSSGQVRLVAATGHRPPASGVDRPVPSAAHP
jgi:carbonic anhydrase